MESSLSARAGQPAPYGRACMQCFKSKCKCVLRDDGDRCERCFRLNRPCTPSDPIRRRRAHKGHNSPSTVAKLEGRIDTLVSLLQNVTQAPEALAALQHVMKQTTADDASAGESRRSSAVVTPVTETNASASSEQTQPPGEGTLCAAGLDTPASTPGTTINGSNPLHILPDEEQQCLNVFRSHMLPKCPFTVLGPDVTVETLRKDRPFFLRAITTVSSPSTQKKIARATELKRLLCHEIVVENRSNIDVLLAILTYLAWSYDQFLAKKGLRHLTILAMSVVAELGLDDDPDGTKNGSCAPFGKSEEPPPETTTTDRDSEEQSLERHRAVLGCFLLSSTVSSYLGKMEPMQWTSNLEKRLRILETRAPGCCSSDASLALQVRLQVVVQKALDAQRQQEHTSPAMVFYRNSLRHQLREIETSVPTDNTSTTNFLRIRCRFIDLILADMEGKSEPSPLAPGSDLTALRKFDSMWQSLAAVKECFNALLSVQPEDWIGFPLVASVQISHCMGILFSLSTLDDPAWDCQMVRSTCDLAAILSTIECITAQASVAAGETADDGLFFAMSGNMRKFREAFLLKLSQMAQQQQQSPIPAPAAVDAGMFLATTSSSSAAATVFPPYTWPFHEFFGTGEWMESIFDGNY